MLSDSCHDFLSSIATTAATLLADVQRYAQPPFSYSPEDISRLRSACEAVLSSAPTVPPDAMLSLVTAVYVTLKRYDTPPWEESD